MSRSRSWKTVSFRPEAVLERVLAYDRFRLLLPHIVVTNGCVDIEQLHLFLALLIFSKKQTSCAPDSVAEVANQLLALPQIRPRSVDSRELEGFVDL